jgi:hypothetical protein
MLSSLWVPLSPPRRWALRLRATYTAKSNAFEKKRGNENILSRVTAGDRTKEESKATELQGR